MGRKGKKMKTTKKKKAGTFLIDTQQKRKKNHKHLCPEGHVMVKQIYPIECNVYQKCLMAWPKCLIGSPLDKCNVIMSDEP